MPPFNVFKVFGGSNKSASNAYPPQGAPSSVSGRKLSRRRDTRHSSHVQPPQMAYPPTLTVISEDDLSRHMSVNEDHGHYEAAPSMAHESFRGNQDMVAPAPSINSHSQLPVEPGHPRVRLVDPPVQTHYAQFHEELEDSDGTQSDGEDGRKHTPEHRSAHSRSVHGQSIRSNRGDPYMGRTPTPYHPASVAQSITDTQPRPIIINNPEPPTRSSRTRDRHRDRPEEHGRRASASVAPNVDPMPFSSHSQGTSPTQYPYSGYGPSIQPQRAPSAHRRTSRRSRKEDYDSSPPYIVGPDVNNTYCYIVPRGTNVIFQDEDGHEITRVGKFHPTYLSREPSNQAARKHTVPIVVQDEFGQELYRTGSITHRSYPDQPGTPVRRSPSMTQHGSQPFLPYQHGGPNVVLVDRSGHQIPIATNPHRTTREVRSEHFY